MKKIAFISLADPNDRKSWSGTLYSEYHELEKYYELVSYVVKFNPLILSFVKFRERVRYVITKRTYLPEYSSVIMNRFAVKPVNKALKKNNYDYVFVVAGSTLLPFIKSDKPIIYMSDAVFSRMKDYYFIDINSTVEKNGNLFEQISIDRSSAVILSSQWGYEGALEYCKSNKEKIHMIPFGANIDIDDRTSLKRKIDDVVHIVFIGVDWKRKGGDIAVETVRYLNTNSKLKFELDILGGRPEYKIEDKNIHIHGFIDKNSEEGMNKFKDIIASCHLLLLPTKAECSAIAFCEASAYSLPIVTYKTGGITTYVRDGYNGKTLTLGSSPIDFANAILDIVSDRNTYCQYSKNAREMYFNELNWTVWGKRVKKVIDDIEA